MTQILNDITAYLSALLANRPVMAVLIGLVFSLALTQWLKFVLLRTKWLPDPNRWIIRALALPIGAGATFAALPADMEWIMRLLLGMVVGASAPYVYQLMQAVLWKFAPEVAKRLSVDPYQGDG